MFLNDPLHVFRRDVAIPGAFRIDDRDRSAVADAQTVTLGAIKRSVRAGDVELFETILQIDPGFLAGIRGDAIGTDADEQVPRELADAESGSDHVRGKVVRIGHTGNDSCASGAK